jgi:hypothetical protein
MCADGLRLVNPGLVVVVLWIWRVALMSLVVGLAVMNAAGVASQLVAMLVAQHGISIVVEKTKRSSSTPRLSSRRIDDLRRTG